MTTYQVYCESCGSDHEVQIAKEKVKFCSVCGAELDESNINESDSYDDDEFEEEPDWEWKDDER
jgi:rRNA maturation endonuclease Nob1